MNYAPQIVDSFKASVLERILVIDDAYDPPELQEDRGGDLVNVLESPDLRIHLSDEVFCEDDRQAAIEAVLGNDFDHEAVSRAIATLYSTYVDTRAAAVDPGGEFTGQKGPALEALDPLVELLGRCADAAQIRKVGKGEAARAYREQASDLILMDFFLSPPERSVRAATRGESDADRNRSINLLKRILGDDPVATPSVILMSSEDVGDRTQAYRGRLEGRVTAFRFGFLYKEWINGDGNLLTASGQAADVLMDTSRSFEFGRTLESALQRWKAGATAGLEKLYEELSDFDIKDFAYLLRFRLYQEREPFADYLEWFLGESLRAVVDGEVEWRTEYFSRLDQPRLTEAIEGAHPIPSDRTAKFFHRMRFNSRESRERKRLALGDLFIASNSKDVRVVITPDCDLVPRKHGPRARRVLSMGGKIWGLESDQALAGELIFSNAPKAIKWHYKDLMTHEFDDITTLHVGEMPYSYSGSLRAMSAQMLQKAALADLSRVGLAVPPTVDVGAPVKVFVRKNSHNQSLMVELEGIEEPRAQVFMPRGGNDVHKRLLFTRRFVRDLIARVEGLDEGDLVPDHRGYWHSWIGGLTRVRRAMLIDGLELSGNSLFKMGVLVGSEQGKNWLEIVVDVSDEALIQLQGMDPLVD